jgi:hypothetical protein
MVAEIAKTNSRFHKASHFNDKFIFYNTSNPVLSFEPLDFKEFGIVIMILNYAQCLLLSLSPIWKVAPFLVNIKPSLYCYIIDIVLYIDRF